jgi:hypothetical protein
MERSSKPGVKKRQKEGSGAFAGRGSHTLYTFQLLNQNHAVEFASDMLMLGWQGCSGKNVGAPGGGVEALRRSPISPLIGTNNVKAIA